MPQQPTYTINEAAALTGLHRNTIRQRIRLGQLDATIQPGKFGDEYRIAHGALVSAGLLDAQGPLGEEVPAEAVLDAEFTPEGETGARVQTAVPIEETHGEGAHALAHSTLTALAELYQRHEQAMFRLGYLQSELERVKSLAETAESLQQDRAARDEQLDTLRGALHESQLEKERQAREAETLRLELERAQERLREMETLRQDIDQLKNHAGKQERLIDELVTAAQKRPWWQFWKG